MMTDYWETHYQDGGDSGPGSRGRFAELKRDLIHAAIEEHDITSILELGSGDGYVANLIEHDDYLGLDPSPAAVALARKAAPQHRFEVYPDEIEPRDTHLSQDVIRHLMEADTYNRHMADLFSAYRVVLVWSSDVDKYWSPQELEHNFTADVPRGWEQVQCTPIPGINSNFYVYQRTP